MVNRLLLDAHRFPALSARLVMVPTAGLLRWGTPVVPPGQLDPRKDRLGLYLWGTIVWHLLIVLGTVLLILGGRALLNF